MWDLIVAFPGHCLSFRLALNIVKGAFCYIFLSQMTGFGGI